MGSTFTSTSTPALNDDLLDTVARGKWNYLYELLDQFGTHVVTDSALFNWGTKGGLYVANTTTGVTLLTPSAAGKYLKDNGVGNDPSWEWGSLVQTVHTEFTTAGTTTAVIPIDNTIPQSTEGTELFTATITPKYTDSRLEIQAVISCACTYTGGFGIQPAVAALFRDSLADALATGLHAAAFSPNGGVIVLTHTMTSPGTSSTTFKIRFGSSGGNTAYYNQMNGNGTMGGVMKSALMIKEFKA
jgi:hypothetical protein